MLNNICSACKGSFTGIKPSPFAIVDSLLSSLVLCGVHCLVYGYYQC